MPETGFSMADAVLTSAMSGGFNRSAGGGIWNNEGNGGVAPWAGPGSIRADILSNRDIAQTGIENVERSIAEGRTSSLVTTGHEKICDNINNTGNRITDNQFRSELRLSDHQATTTAQLVAMAAAQAKCCCEQQLQTERLHAESMARMEALSKETVAHERDLAERELMAIKYADSGHHGH